MGISVSFGRRLRAAALVLALALGPLLAACATGGYAGIRFAPGAADAELQALARRAQAGDDRAQLELGLRYEEGRGVRADLARARDLYFKAATRPSANRIAVYVPTRGGTVSSITRVFPAAAEFSGLEEAYEHWYRLMPHAGTGAARAQTGRAGETRPARGRGRVVPDHGEDLELLRLRAIGDYAYDPIFRGLPSNAPLDEALGGQLPTHFFDSRAVDDTFLLLLNPGGVGEPGRRAPADAVRRFCDESLGIGSSWTQARVRLFALCLAKLSTGEPAVFRRRLAAARAALSGYRHDAFGLSADAADDRILLFRAGQYCRCAPDIDPLLIEAAREIGRIRAHATECEAYRCGDALLTSYGLVQHASSNMFLAYLENPAAGLWSDGEVARVMADNSGAIRNRLRTFADQVRDEVMTRQCQMLGYDYAPCRAIHFNGPFLIGKTVFLLSEFLSDPAPLAARCARFRIGVGQAETELSFRPELLTQLNRFSATVCAS